MVTLPLAQSSGQAVQLSLPLHIPSPHVIDGGMLSDVETGTDGTGKTPKGAGGTYWLAVLSTIGARVSLTVGNGVGCSVRRLVGCGVLTGERVGSGVGLAVVGSGVISGVGDGVATGAGVNGACGMGVTAGGVCATGAGTTESNLLV